MALANPFAVLRLPGVWRLWAIGIATGVIRWLELLAFALIVLEQSGSPLLVAIVTLVRLLPLLLASLPIAALAERLPLRGFLGCGLGVMLAMNALLLGVELALGGVGVWLLLPAAFVSGVFWTLDQTVRRVLLAAAGGSGTIGATMGLDVATNQLTRILGSLAGGAAVEFIGQGGVFGFAIGVYALALILLASLAQAPANRPGSVRQVAVIADFLATLHDGWRYAAGHPLLPAICAVTIVFNLFAFPYTALLPAVGEDELGLGPTAIGALVAVESLGAFTASLVIAATVRPAQFARLYVLGALLCFLGIAGFGLAGTPLVAFPSLLLAGVGVAGFAAMQAAIPLIAVPSALRLRAIGLVNMSIGVAPLGFLGAGLLAELLGPGPAVLTLALLGLLMMAVLLRRWPRLLQSLRPEV